MYGAILGDIIGSPFEFDRGNKTKDFDIFTKGCGFTDDSVMTVAVAEALLAIERDASVEEIEKTVTATMQDWGNRYPHAGYGGRFSHWLRAKNPKPYNSYGNGSAMRVSPAGWLYDSLERTREVARATANVTHNHPEGIKGAEATASAIYMSRNGSSKADIKAYVEKEFDYDLDRTLAEIRPFYHMDESCQRTVPEAIIAFLEAEDFEDAIRNAVSLGGDTDTLGAITGSIAEAYFGIPAVLIGECRARVDEGLMLGIIDEFDDALGREKVTFDINRAIEYGIESLYINYEDEGFIQVLKLIVAGMLNGDEFLVPYISDAPLMSDEQVLKAQRGQVVHIEQDIHMKMETVMNENDETEWMCAFTSPDEMNKGTKGNVRISRPIKDLIMQAMDWEQVSGIVINPFGHYLRMDKALIQNVIEAYNQYV